MIAPVSWQEVCQAHGVCMGSDRRLPTHQPLGPPADGHSPHMRLFSTLDM